MRSGAAHAARTVCFSVKAAVVRIQGERFGRWFLGGIAPRNQCPRCMAAFQCAARKVSAVPIGDIACRSQPLSPYQDARCHLFSDPRKATARARLSRTCQLCFPRTCTGVKCEAHLGKAVVGDGASPGSPADYVSYSAAAQERSFVRMELNGANQESLSSVESVLMQSMACGVVGDTFTAAQDASTATIGPAAAVVSSRFAVLEDEDGNEDASDKSGSDDAPSP
eukprot:351939-Chlamydomonas_euryale.AAC.1